MEAEDLEPRTLRPKPTDLDVMSIESLEEYIEELHGEIARAQAAIDAKTAHRQSAEAFFKK